MQRLPPPHQKTQFLLRTPNAAVTTAAGTYNPYVKTHGVLYYPATGKAGNRAQLRPVLATCLSHPMRPKLLPPWCVKIRKYKDRKMGRWVLAVTTAGVFEHN
jgi:hypothetical protein